MRGKPGKKSRKPEFPSVHCCRKVRNRMPLCPSQSLGQSGSAEPGPEAGASWILICEVGKAGRVERITASFKWIPSSNWLEQRLVPAPGRTWPGKAQTLPLVMGEAEFWPWEKSDPLHSGRAGKIQTRRDSGSLPTSEEGQFWSGDAQRCSLVMGHRFWPGNAQGCPLLMGHTDSDQETLKDAP